MDGTILNKKLKIEEKLAQLNEIAQKVDDMPTFTSDDRAFLEELPGFPVVDGKKVLTATTESGETSLAYEEQESGAVDYSTTEQATGQKWIDGRDIYVKTFNAGALPSSGNVTVQNDIANFGAVINVVTTGISNDGYSFSNDGLVMNYASASSLVLRVTFDATGYNGYVTVYYTKAEVTKKAKSKK